MSRQAPADEIRRAYHDLARLLHPDRVEGRETPESDGADRRMQEVNEAWRILRDPASRAAYDAAISGGDRRRTPRPPRSAYPNHPGRAAPTIEVDDDYDDDLDTPFHGRPAEPGDLTVSVARALPWLVVAIVLVAIFVFTAFARKDPTETPSSPESLVGSCVMAQGSGMAAVPCEGPNDGQVVAVVVSGGDCPSASVARRASSTEWFCLVPVSQGATGTTSPRHP